MPTDCLFSFCGFVQSFGHGIFFCWCFKAGKGSRLGTYYNGHFGSMSTCQGRWHCQWQHQWWKGIMPISGAVYAINVNIPFFRWHFITHGKGRNTVEIHLNLDPGKSLNHIFPSPYASSSVHTRPFFSCDESLWRGKILSHPFSDASKSRNQIGGFENSDTKPWSMLFLFGEGFIFLQRKLGQKLVSGNKNTGTTYQKKTGMMYSTRWIAIDV